MPFCFAVTKPNRVISPKLNCKRLSQNGYGSKSVTLGMHRPSVKISNTNSSKRVKIYDMQINWFWVVSTNTQSLGKSCKIDMSKFNPNSIQNSAKVSTQELITSTEGPRGRTKAYEHRVWKRVHVSSWVELSPLLIRQERQVRAWLMGSGQSNNGEME